MAIGAIFNSLIYGGVDSADYGVYVTGDAVFNAPKRAVELVSVPGRNGAIEIDQGHFENIEVSYPAGMFGDDQTDFRERLSDFRNAIMSQKGYQRLSDTYHPDEFRMGIYVDGLEVEPKHYNEAGQFTLKFNCKPQRFLTSGEEEIIIGEWEGYETVTGDKVSFEADDTTKIKDIKTDINPKQAGDAWSSSPEQAPYLLRRSPQLGHNYFKEFDTLIGGSIAWNQMFNYPSGSYTHNGITTVMNNDNTISASGTASESYANVRDLSTRFTNIIGNHVYLFDPIGVPSGATCNIQFFNASLTNENKGHGIIKANANATQGLYRMNGLTVGTQYNFTLSNLGLIDLTQLFANNPAIADYVYSLEQTTAGSGIAWLKSYGFLGKDYFAYDAGSLVSVKTTAHVMRDEDDAIIGNYPLDSDLELRGIPKLSNGAMYYDGDTYTADGTVTRKYGIVDLGTLTWTYQSGDARFASSAISDMKPSPSGRSSEGIITAKYVASTGGSDKTIFKYINKDIYIYDSSYTDAATFKTAMSGVYLVYELATPTTETADSFTNMQDVSPDGTEEYVDSRSVPVPVGHRTTYSAVYPISPYFDIDIYHSPTPDSADATEYEIGTGTAGDVYGGELDVTEGKLLVTDKNINYYDGETLPSTWISDRDQYAPGTTPSIGAQVVYKLASPEEYDVTPTQIDALIGSNYIWSNSGNVTVEYGWDPNLLVNPTLFDARPLLMVEGYGNIEMNGKEIELKRVVIGNVSIAGAETKQFGTSITMEIGFNPEQFNTGDAISVNPFVFASDYYYELHGDELTLYTATDQLQGTQTTFQKEGTSYYKIQTAWPALTFYVGTDAEYTNEAIITGEAGGQGFLNQRLYTKVELSHRSSTYAVIKFTFNSGSMYEDLYVIATERKLILNGINGDSTLLTLGHPTYIDCDLGEAYMIKNGTAISLNAYIDLGSDLPSLGPGLNRIDFDDTITELKLRPDWWKV